MKDEHLETGISSFILLISFAWICAIVYSLIPDLSILKALLNESFCHPSISSMDTMPLKRLVSISPKLLNKLPTSLNCNIFSFNVGLLK